MKEDMVYKRLQAIAMLAQELQISKEEAEKRLECMCCYKKGCRWCKK